MSHVMERWWCSGYGVSAGCCVGAVDIKLIKFGRKGLPFHCCSLSKVFVYKIFLYFTIKLRARIPASLEHCQRQIMQPAHSSDSDFHINS